MKILQHSIDSGLTPVVFTDGSDIYAKLAETYVKHDTGRFILAPSGSGKSYYVDNQTTKDWIDGDLLWVVTGADYSNDEWDESIDDIMEINARSDVITHQSKKQGFWVIGSSNMYLQPDAIVIPDWDTHLKYISLRENNKYDGGATSNDLDGLKSHIQWITTTWHGKVPFFTSIEDAVHFLNSETS